MVERFADHLSTTVEFLRKVAVEVVGLPERELGVREVRETPTTIEIVLIWKGLLKVATFPKEELERRWQEWNR